MNYSGKPYEGKPHVRFDEGARETVGQIPELRPCPALQIQQFSFLFLQPLLNNIGGGFLY